MSQEAITNSKACRKCSAHKPIAEFYKDARFPDGIDIHCSTCRKEKVGLWREKNLEKARESQRKSYAKNPVNNRIRASAWYIHNKEKNREHALKFRFGITLQEYDVMAKSQDHCCEICGKHQSQLKQSLSVDHCHSTGNTGLGHFKDNPKLLENALVYIYEHITRKN
jgi:hypothetical protein